METTEPQTRRGDASWSADWRSGDALAAALTGVEEAGHSALAGVLLAAHGLDPEQAGDGARVGVLLEAHGLDPGEVRDVLAKAPFWSVDWSGMPEWRGLAFGLCLGIHVVKQGQTTGRRRGTDPVSFDINDLVLAIEAFDDASDAVLSAAQGIDYGEARSMLSGFCIGKHWTGMPAQSAIPYGLLVGILFEGLRLASQGPATGEGPEA